jgi:hypothetical protein
MGSLGLASIFITQIILKSKFSSAGGLFLKPGSNETQVVAGFNFWDMEKRNELFKTHELWKRTTVNFIKISNVKNSCLSDCILQTNHLNLFPYDTLSNYSFPFFHILETKTCDDLRLVWSGLKNHSKNGLRTKM